MKLGQPSDESIENLLAAMRSFPQLRDAFGNAGNAPSSAQLEKWHKEASKAEGISRTTLVEIVGCKNASGPGKARIVEQARSNDEVEVGKQTELAFSSATTAEEAISALCNLHGVGVPTASAILSWCFPERYAVIDWRVWQTLYRFGVARFECNSEQLRAKDYAWYMKQVATLCERLPADWTPQKVDRWLYAFSKCQFMPEHFS